MLLSKYGKERLHDFGLTLNNRLDGYEFTQDDFENAVILSLSEAKGIYETIKETQSFLWKMHGVPLSNVGQRDFELLQKRIKEARNTK